VGKNLAPAIPHDELALRYMRSEAVRQLIRTMNERGWLGTKTKQGFYKEVRTPDGGKEFYVLKLKTMEHEPSQKVRFDSIGKVKDEGDLGKRLKVLLAADDRAGQLVRAITYQGLAYACDRIPEIADTPRAIDDAMRWGFGREAGPFETWDTLGVAETIPAMTEAGFPPHPWVHEMLANGCPSFYQYAGDTKVGVYNPARCAYESIPRQGGLVLLKEQGAAGKIVKKNLGASIIDLGDGVACVEFHTKMNTLDADVLGMLNDALDYATLDFEGLVIGSEAENFSAGANLFLAVMAAQGGMWDDLYNMVKGGQDLNMRMRYFPRPIVGAPAGLALGGGAEIPMHTSRIVAGAELYMGLVEIGAGVIPAWGGTKEMIRRLVNPPLQTKGVEVLPFLQRAFEQIGLAKVSTSAEEARQMGFLSPRDRVVLSRDLLLTEAKREVLHMASSGYQPPVPEKIYAAGRDSLGALRVGIHMMKEGGYITEYESHIAGKLAYVLTGGEISSPAWVDEEYILELEREAFLSLCGEQKTQARMWNILQTGKPLRN
jgi:3-hydroxyacyl-CoA dehydrogenase